MIEVDIFTSIPIEKYHEKFFLVYLIVYFSSKSFWTRGNGIRLVLSRENLDPVVVSDSKKSLSTIKSSTCDHPDTNQKY